MSKELIRLSDCVVQFDDEIVLDHLNLYINDKEFLTLLGPSGCGKTTTLRIIGGFQKPTSGDVFFDGRRCNDLPPYKRQVNTVFQKYALFTHLNIFENVAFGLRIAKVPEAEITRRVEEALELVNLPGYGKRSASSLSGGQQQRVAIARAIVNRPQVLLLDEPLAALDLKLRKDMQVELKRIQREVGITFIYVTHDQEEAMTMSDRIAVMHDGEIEQLDTPANIYDRPKTRFVADFVGESNILEAEAAGRGEDGRCLFSTRCGRASGIAPELAEGEKVFLCIRPEVLLASTQEKDGFSIRGRVTEHISTGNLVKTLVRTPDGTEWKLSRLAGTEVFPVGSDVCLSWNADACAVMEG